MIRGRRHAGVGVLFVVAAAASLGGCSRLPWARRARPPVILISVDTLRADRLPAYGFTGVETPAIDGLRRDGVLFTRAFSHVPLTLPSHLSMLTGRMPFEHGVRDNAGYELPAEVRTLAEELKADGYATGAAVSSFVLAKATGVGRGFDFYEDRMEPSAPHEAMGEVQRPGAVTEALLERWVEGAGERPFFAFLHLYEPHVPYDPPEPFRSRYAGQPYLGEIAAADEVVGRFLGFLRRRGLYDKALILFVSDHGEGLGDHGEMEHGIFLYREAVHVPFVAKLPRALRAGTVSDVVVGLADVFPTVLAAVRGSAPALPYATDALAGTPAVNRRIYSETLYTRLHLGWSDLASLTDGRWHYIESPRSEIYDIDADPGERRDLSPGAPEAFRALRVALSAYERSFRPPSAAEAERRAKLASLGYLSAAPAAAGPLPDPKDRIADYAIAQRAMSLSAAGRDAEAIPQLEAVLKGSPTSFDVWFSYALSLSRLGRLDHAIEAGREGMRRAPSDSPQLVRLLAELYLQKGNGAEALRHAQLARQMGDVTADFFLPDVYLVLGNLARAEESARSCVEHASSPTLPRMVLARVLQAKGDPQGAFAQTDLALQALRESGGKPLVLFHLYRGELLVALGRLPEGVAELETEIRLFPGRDESTLALCRAYALGRRSLEARTLAEQAVARNPRSPEVLQKALIALEAGTDSEGAAVFRRRGQRAFPGDVRFQLPR